MFYIWIILNRNFNIILFQVIVKIMAEYEQMLQKKHALLNRVESATNETERQQLRRVSSNHHIAATLLPIRTVGVQVNNIFFLPKFIMKVCIIKLLNVIFLRAIDEVTVTLLVYHVRMWSRRILYGKI